MVDVVFSGLRCVRLGGNGMIGTHPFLVLRCYSRCRERERKGDRDWEGGGRAVLVFFCADGVGLGLGMGVGDGSELRRGGGVTWFLVCVAFIFGVLLKSRMR